MGQTAGLSAKNLQFPVVFSENLRFPAVFCENLRSGVLWFPSKAKSAKACKRPATLARFVRFSLSRLFPLEFRRVAIRRVLLEPSQRLYVENWFLT